MSARQPWSPADVLHLRWYAQRGLSLAEAAKLMDRSPAGAANEASRLGIRFHGPSGAPFLNRNAARARWLKELKQIAAGLSAPLGASAAASGSTGRSSPRRHLRACPAGRDR